MPDRRLRMGIGGLRSESLYDPGTREEIRARFDAAERRGQIPVCCHSHIDWSCMGCLYGQIERMEYVIKDYRDALLDAERRLPTGDGSTHSALPGEDTSATKGTGSSD